MPYKSEKIKISGTQYDRRIKLTPEDKEEIIRLQKEKNMSQRALARTFHVSRRLITFILDPEKLEKNRIRQKEMRSTGKYKPTKEQWADTQREHRNYKEKLSKEGKI